MALLLEEEHTSLPRGTRGLLTSSSHSEWMHLSSDNYLLDYIHRLLLFPRAEPHGANTSAWEELKALSVAIGWVVFSTLN